MPDYSASFNPHTDPIRQATAIFILQMAQEMENVCPRLNNKWFQTLDFLTHSVWFIISAQKVYVEPLH